MKPWRMKEKCSDCPFHESGPGRQLRDSLAPGRFAEIQVGLLTGEVFFCHKHAQYDEDDEETDTYRRKEGDRVCAGAIEFQERHNCVPQAVQVCERLERMWKARKESP